MQPPAQHRILLAGLPAAFVAAAESRLPSTTVVAVTSAGEMATRLLEGSWSFLGIHHSIVSEGGLMLQRARSVRPELSELPVAYCAPAELQAATAQSLVAQGVGRILVEPDPETFVREIAARLQVRITVPDAPGIGIANAVGSLWEKFRPAISSRIDTLEDATVALLEGSLDAALHEAVVRDVHKLTGSLGTYGFRNGSRLAAEAERLLTEGDLGIEHALRLSEIATALRTEIERAPETSTADDAQVAGTEPLVLAVTQTGPLVRQLNVAIPAQGWHLQLAQTLIETRHLIQQRAPDALILDQDAIPDAFDVGALIAELAARIPPVPVVVLADDAKLDERVMVARAGATALLPRDIPIAQVVVTLEQAVRQREQASASVLAVDDDPQILDALQAVLQPRGITVTTLSDPLRFWHVLQETTPDLLVLDVDMPHLSGIDLCQVVRSDPRWSSLPILFLTARRDAETILRVFDSGADDYISKPLVGPELVTRITNRIERVHLYRHLAETDFLTGVNNRRRADGIMERFLRLAIRRHQSYSVAVLDVDGLRAINERYGHSAGDRVLRHLAELLIAAFRTEDIVSRRGGQEFAVGLYSMTKELAAQRLALVLDRLAEKVFTSADGVLFRATFTGGVAEFPRDGGDLPSLYRAAQDALQQAKAAGRNRVIPLGADPTRVKRTKGVDVLLVEDDDALVDLLVPMLETQGFKTEVIADGPTAVEALTGPMPSLRARVVLLDVDLPGLDGLSVLRQLGRDGVLRQSRAVMLTARSSESEIIAALDMGAYDHVSKPFSVPVLMHRVRRAMGVL
jgi:diguanylate cyclase (GGDEF)-like protein